MAAFSASGSAFMETMASREALKRWAKLGAADVVVDALGVLGAARGWPGGPYRSRSTARRGPVTHPRASRRQRLMTRPVAQGVTLPPGAT